MKNRDFKAAYELAHGLKGMYANLSLTPLSVPLSEITEHLRAQTDMDYTALMNEIILQKQKLDELTA